MQKEVKNPWEEIKGPNFYTTEDEAIIRKFNNALKKKDKEGKIVKEEKDSDFYIDLELMPEPYLGNPYANIILLFTNPGKKGTEAKEYDDYDGFKDALIANLTHTTTDYPYCYFNPAFKKEVNGKQKYIAGADWLLRRTKDLRKALGNDNLNILSKGIFTLQLHPYHSKKFKMLPKLEVDKYTVHLFKNAIKRAKQKKALIICIRNYKEWNEVYKNAFHTTNDFAHDLSENFIILKKKDGKAPRTPYFNENLLGKDNFNRVVQLLNIHP